MRAIFRSPWLSKPRMKQDTVHIIGCGSSSCSGARSLWHRVRRGHHGIMLEGALYCCPQSLESALVGHFSRLHAAKPTPAVPNRIPLGLLMVSRGTLTYDQVLTALAAQRHAGSGKIGEWFEKLGLATEQEVVTALALQWGCPVASSFALNGTAELPHIPLSILEAFQMWPLHRVHATNTLYIACGERVDHGALYAIERMLDCRTQACVAAPRGIAGLIERMRQQSRSGQVEFGPMRDVTEMARVALSYVARLGADEIRISRLGSLIWLLLKARSATTNLVFRLRSSLVALHHEESELGQELLTTSA